MKYLLIGLVASVLIFWGGFTAGLREGYLGRLTNSEMQDIEQEAFLYGQLEQVLADSPATERAEPCKELSTIDGFRPKGWVTLDSDFTKGIDTICRLHEAEN